MEKREPYLLWWSELNVGPRYELMRKYDCSSVTNKWIKRIFKKEFQPTE